jgi:hypothetical protein
MKLTRAMVNAMGSSDCNCPSSKEGVETEGSPEGTSPTILTPCPVKPSPQTTKIPTTNCDELGRNGFADSLGTNDQCNPADSNREGGPVDGSDLFDGIQDDFMHVMRTGNIDPQQVLQLTQPDDQRSRRRKPGNNGVGEEVYQKVTSFLSAFGGSSQSQVAPSAQRSRVTGCAAYTAAIRFAIQ